MHARRSRDLSLTLYFSTRLGQGSASTLTTFTAPFISCMHTHPLMGMLWPTLNSVGRSVSV